MSLERAANITLERLKKVKPGDVIYYRLMNMGNIHTGCIINGTRYWHFKKDDIIRNQKMHDYGVLIERPNGETEIRYNS